MKRCKLCQQRFTSSHGRQVFCHDCLSFRNTGKVMIYGLCDVRDGVIRYVGATANPVARYIGHLRNKEDNNKRLTKWRKAVGENLRMTKIAIVAPENRAAKEEEAIRSLHLCDLLNHRAAKERVLTQKQALAQFEQWSKANE